jgi:hypothetical protein
MQSWDPFSYFLKIPNFNLQPSGIAATRDLPRFVFRQMRRLPTGAPEPDDLNSVAVLSHDNLKLMLPHIRAQLKGENVFSIKDREELYSSWFSQNPGTFLLLERRPPDRHKVDIIANTAILPLRNRVFKQIQRNEKFVIKLHGQDICAPGVKYDVLLFDTWVMHEDYQDYHFSRSMFKRWRGEKHGGFGQALTLRHLAMFWNPDLRNTKTIKIYAELDSEPLIKLIGPLGFTAIGNTATDAPLMELKYPLSKKEQQANLHRYDRIQAMVRCIEKVGTWPLEQ